MPKQDALKQTLARFVRGGRLSHAVLIEGPAGSGREELALWLARSLVCEGENAPCGQCLPCRKISSGNHPDVEVMRGESKSGVFTVEQVRSVREGLWLSPGEAGYRIYILLDIDDMNAEAQNAFLKSLEEPPPFARFIMTCRNRSALLETIVSRASVFTLDPPSPAECAAELTRLLPEASRRDAALAALCWDGCVGAADAALRSEEGMAPARMALSTLEFMRRGDTYSLMAALAKEASSREAFLEYIERLGSLAALAALPAGNELASKLLERPVSARAAVGVADAAEKAASAMHSNCSPELVGSWFCGELAKVFGGNI